MAKSAEFFERNLPETQAAFRLKTEMQNERTSLSAFPWLIQRLIKTSREKVISANDRLVQPREGLTPEVQERVWQAAMGDFVSITFCGILSEMPSAIEGGEFRLGTVLDVFNDNTRGTVIEPYKPTQEDLEPEKIPEDKLLKLRKIIETDPTYASLFSVINVGVLPNKLRKFILAQNGLSDLIRDVANDWRALAGEFLKVTSDGFSASRPPRTKVYETLLGKSEADQEAELLKRGFTKEQIDAFVKMSTDRKS